MVLLFVPTALASPSFSLVWVIPAAAPIIEGLASLIPSSPDVPFSPNLPRLAIPWLILELLTAMALVYRGRVSERRRSWLTRPMAARRDLAVAGWRSWDRRDQRSGGTRR